MSGLRTIGTAIFVLAPISIWIMVIVAIKLLQVIYPECSFSGGGALGCGSLGNWLYDMAMIFAFFGIVGQVVWLIPALILVRVFRRE
ncbi:hypothetical protein [Pseudophaeobacter sp.]|uniref:hypothetical protein n=1 Tax=Pseudophaeobacter sp. TaxID=1971739 RepID=UPI004058B8E8